LEHRTATVENTCDPNVAELYAHQILRLIRSSRYSELCVLF